MTNAVDRMGHSLPAVSEEDTCMNITDDVTTIRAEVGKLVEISKAVDDAWRAGDRSGMVAAVWGLSDATQKLFAALQSQDAPAFFEAADLARERAFRAAIHGRNWRKAQAQ